MIGFRLPNPASLSAEERAAYRDAAVGSRYNRQRTDLPDGSCYYTTEDAPGRFILTAFAGKSLRPSFIKHFRTREVMEEHAAAFVASRERAADARLRQRIERKAPHSLAEGMILAASWGYDETIVDFYQVIAVRGAYVQLRQIAGERTEDGRHVVPVRDAFIGPPLRRRPTPRNSVRISSAACAFPWDGRPQYTSM